MSDLTIYTDLLEDLSQLIAVREKVLIKTELAALHRTSKAVSGKTYVDEDGRSYKGTKSGGVKYKTNISVDMLKYLIARERLANSITQSGLNKSDIATIKTDLSNRYTKDQSDKTFITKGGGLDLSFKKITSSYTLKQNDYSIRIDSTDNAVTATLPVELSGTPIFNIKKIKGGNQAKISSTALIDDGAADIILTLNENVTVQWDGEKYQIL